MKCRVNSGLYFDSPALSKINCNSTGRNPRLFVIKLLLVFVIVVFCFLRFFYLAADVPVGTTWSSEIYGDEGLYTRNATAKVLTNRWLLPYESNPIVVMPIFQFIEYIFLDLMGINLISARLPGVLFFIITLIFLYALFRRFYNDIFSLGALALISCNYLLFVYSRLALNENLMTLLSVIAIYLASLYNKHFIYVVLTPLVISLAVLSKISALSVWLPVFFLILYESDGLNITSKKLRRLACSILIFMALCFLYIGFIIKPYHDYGGYYLAIVPIFPESMHGLSSVIYAVYKIFRNGYLISHGIYSIGYVVGIISMIAIVFVKRLKHKRLLGAFVLWVVVYVFAGAIGGGYNPPRYYILTVIPLLSIMFFFMVHLWFLHYRHKQVLRVGLTVLMVCYMVLNIGKIFPFLVHPEWSFKTMSDDISRTIQSTQKPAVILTDIVDTYALASGMLVLNLETGPEDKKLKFARYQPHFLITLGPVSDNLRNFQDIKQYGCIELLEIYDVFENYHNGKPVHFYQIEPHSDVD